MVLPDEYDINFDRRIANALLYFCLPEYENTFILFTINNKEDFDFDNINEDEVRIAYIYKDDSNGGYAYLKPIKNINVLRAASKYALEYLYHGHKEKMKAYEIIEEIKKKIGIEEE